MRKLCIIAEGATEENFIHTCLAPYLLTQGLLVYSSILSARSGNHAGGRVTVERMGKQLAYEYHQTDRITTLVDYYGFQDSDGRSRAQLETDILSEADKWGRGKLEYRFILPYVQLHEFEGLLFTDVNEFKYVADGWNDEALEQLKAVRAAFATPEDINNSKETSPSHRLKDIFRGQYRKTEHGPLIAEAIGLEKIRAACPQFHNWLTQLEAWGAA
jgi:hypothetical protein